VSAEPQGVPELLKPRAVDVVRVALLLGVAAIVVIWLLDVPGTRVWMFAATAVALVLFLALAFVRLRAVRRLVAERLPALSEETVVVAVAEAMPVHLSPTFFLRRGPEGLRFELAADPTQTVLLAADDIHSVEVTTLPAGILITLAGGARLRLGIVTPRLSTPRAPDLQRLRDWMKAGSRFPAELGAASFGAR
jgi:hypothetical protein